MKKAIYRLLINWYQASDKPLPAWLSRACDSDRELSMERDQGEILTRSLKKRPQEPDAYRGDDMTARVMRQITEQAYFAEQEGMAKQKGGFLRIAGLTGVACALAIVGFQFWQTGGLDDSQLGGEGPAVVVHEDSGSNSNTSSGSGADGGLNLQVLEGDWKNPLDQEIEYVISDAKGALDFLTTSFVPSGMLKKQRSEDRA